MRAAPSYQLLVERRMGLAGAASYPPRFFCVLMISRLVLRS